MTSEQQKQRLALEKYAEVLRENNFGTHLALSEADRPFDVLVTQLEPDDSAPGLELSFLPLDEDDGLDGNAMLQFFEYLPVEVPKSRKRILLAYLHDINARIPLMGFGYSHEDEIFFFRHVAIISTNYEQSDDVILQTVWMINYLISTFLSDIQAVAAGDEPSA